MYFVTLLILVYSTKEYKKIYNKFYQILKSYTSSWFFNSLHFQHFLKVFLKWITNKLPIVVQLLSCVCLWPHGLQQARFPCPSLSARVCSNSYPLIQWWHPTISSSVTPSPPTFSLSQHQGLFQWVSYSHQVAKILEFQLQHQSFQWTPRTDLL